MNKKPKILLFFIFCIFILKNTFTSNVVAADVICRNEDFSHKIVHYPGIIWTKESTMYDSGIRAFFHLNLKTIKDGKPHQIVYDRLLSFYPYNLRNIYITASMVEKLVKFILGDSSQPFKLDYINIFTASIINPDFKLDIIDVTASSPKDPSMPKIPYITLKPRHLLCQERKAKK